MDNTFENDNAWGVVFQPYPDSGTPPANVIAAGQDCHGGTMNYNLLNLMTVRCLYDDWGNALIDNTFTDDGSYGNPTNGDFAELTLLGGEPINCYSGNTDTGGTLHEPRRPTSRRPTASAARSPRPAARATSTSRSCCRRPATPRRSGPGFCPAGEHRLSPRHQGRDAPAAAQPAEMPNPCKDVPKNPWCRGRQTGLRGRLGAARTNVCAWPTTPKSWLAVPGRRPM